MLVGFGYWCKWIRGFRLLVLVVSWVWVVSASGFWLCFLGLSCCVFWVWLMGFLCFLCFLGFNGFCGGLLMTMVVVVVLFSVFVLQWIMVATMVVAAAVAMAAVLWLLFTVLDILFYCIVYIILMCNKYYFNV